MGKSIQSRSKMADFDALQKQRMEKDLQELQALIATHFEKRKKDDEELKSLEDRIETRKAERAEMEKEERKAKEEEEERKKAEEEQRRKAAMQSMAGGSAGGARRERGGNRRQTEREKKRKALAERRKPLNVDHLTHEKLLEKVKELAKHAAMIEESKYGYEQQLDRQKYDIFQNRGRVS